MQMTEEHQGNVLIVDDDEVFNQVTKTLIEVEGFSACVATTGTEAIKQCRKHPVDVVLLDWRLGTTPGSSVLREIVKDYPQLPVIVVTGHGSMESAAEALREGAFDYIGKPFAASELTTSLRRAIGCHSRLKEGASEAQAPAPVLSSIIGKSPGMISVYRMIARVAPTDSTVFIIGESGTGKELVARTIHELSPRRPKPFIAINCAAIPETLIESEIFGHEKGAFTGALERRTGCFELAEGGTLLLDEIGEMPVATQAKLLRVLEDRKLRRLGSKVETTVDVRVLAATNKVPEEAVAKGELRNDLYYRLNVFNIHMPLLREHKEDVADLVQALLGDMNAKHGRKVAAVSEAVLNQFRNYSWPGNVRELRNTLERAVIVCDGAMIETKHLPPGFGQTPVRTSADDPDAVRLGVGTTVGEAEKLLILKTLEATSNNKTRAAEILGISLKTLHNKLKEYGASGADAPVLKEE